MSLLLFRSIKINRRFASTKIKTAGSGSIDSSTSRDRKFQHHKHNGNSNSNGYGEFKTTINEHLGMW